MEDFRKKIDEIVENLLKINNPESEDIKKHLEYCFLIKLKNFADERNIKMENPDFNYDNKSINENEDEKLIENENIEDDDIVDNKEDEQNSENDDNNQEEGQWFTLRNQKKINNENLLKFLQEVKDQESGLNLNTSDIPFNKMNEYIIEDLINFFNSNKKDFIQKQIDGNYHYRNFTFDSNIITNILQIEKYESIYKNKFKEQFELLINNQEFTKLDYITVLVIGKSGIGKSTLINHMLKFEDELNDNEIAETRVGFPVTKDTKSYKNPNLPFLNLIDTAGMELSKELNPQNILKNVEEAYKQSNLIVEKENNNYNKYIQCIWYCIKDSDLQEVEINLIKKLKQKSIPIIIIYTYAINIENVQRVKKKIKENFKDLQFIDVLAQEIKSKNSKISKNAYGLNELLNLTLEVCQNYEKGNIYNNLKCLASKEIIKIFKEKNNEIKRNVDEEIINKFISDFTQVLNGEEEIMNFIYNLYEIAFLKFLDDDKEKKEKLDNKSKEIFTRSRKFINDYVKHYKKETENLLGKILDEKSIEYLDIQVKKEIDENTSIRCENKRDNNDFKKVIQIFLNNYFYYISQKYIIHHIISDTYDSFSKKIVEELNKFIEKYILSKEAEKLFRKNFLKKFDNLKDLIKIYSNNDKIYNCEDNVEFLNEENQDKLKEEKPLDSYIKKDIESIKESYKKKEKEKYEALDKKTDIEKNKDISEIKDDKSISAISKKNDNEKLDNLPRENKDENEEELTKKNLSLKDEDCTKKNIGENIVNNDDDIDAPAPAPIHV